MFEIYDESYELSILYIKRSKGLPCQLITFKSTFVTNWIAQGYQQSADEQTKYLRIGKLEAMNKNMQD